MINPRDVIIIRMPFPNIHAELARVAHMYICSEVSGNTIHLIKCQTSKITVKNKLRHFCVEDPDITRNPFSKETIIDCDKEFTSCNLVYDDALKTARRPDICEELMEKINKELSEDGYETICLNESEILKINSLISRVRKI